MCSVGDLGLIPGLGGSPGEGNGYPLQYSGLEKSMGCIDHWVAKNQTRLSDFHLVSVWVLIYLFIITREHEGSATQLVSIQHRLPVNLMIKFA